MRMFKKEEGFTLVELMVVVLIIGILVAIAIPVFNAASRNARLRTCQSNQRTIEGAVQQWLAADPANAWPAAGDLIDGNDPLSAGGAYVKDIPECPAAPSASTLYYSVNASGTVTTDNTAATWLTDGTLQHSHF